MQADEFWCRAYLTAMGAGHVSDVRNSLTHEALALYGEQAADAALEVARRRGMVTGERTARSTPKFEQRVAFRIDRYGANAWAVSTDMYPAGIIVVDGDEVVELADGNTVRIKWSESNPPKPAEVWIERPAKGGA